MRGSTDYTKKVISIILEYGIILFAYLLSGVIRVTFPFGMPYSFLDTITYGHIAFIYATAFVCVNYLLGSYQNLKVDKPIKELIYVLISDVVSGVIVTSVIYLFRLEQISRVFLALFIVVQTMLIMLKRIVLSWVYMKYSLSKGLVFAVVVGRGDGVVTHSFVKKMAAENKELAFKGYFAPQEGDALQGYLGTIEHMENACIGVEAKHIFVIQDEVSPEELQHVVMIGAKHKIKVSIIPSFEQYLFGNGDVQSFLGYKTLRVHLFDTSDIMGVNVAVTNMDKTVALIEDKLDDWRGEYICVANVHTTVTANDDSDYLNIQNSSVMVLPDGGPLSAYSREHHFTEASRVTGPDLMHFFLQNAGEKKYRHYFYGSTQETLDKMAEKFNREFPDAQICGMFSPPFRALTEEEDRDITQMINDAKPDFLWVGLGAPKQEIWMYKHKGKINALMLGVGAAFDYEADNIQRAPQWMQEHSLEWLYRLMQNPRRLFKRYFVTNTKYLLWKFRH